MSRRHVRLVALDSRRSSGCDQGALGVLGAPVVAEGGLDLSPSESTTR